jgi:predicted DNA-binding transcriptional regulator
MNNSSLHEAIISSFLANQRPPTISEIATRFECSELTARKGLQALADYHGVVFHPHSDEVWVAHPFSAAPTTCVVSSGERKWWETAPGARLG